MFQVSNAQMLHIFKIQLVNSHSNLILHMLLKKMRELKFPKHLQICQPNESTQEFVFVYMCWEREVPHIDPLEKTVGTSLKIATSPFGLMQLTYSF